jgi:hypothetical protein
LFNWLSGGKKGIPPDAVKLLIQFLCITLSPSEVNQWMRPDGLQMEEVNALLASKGVVLSQDDVDNFVLASRTEPRPERRRSDSARTPKSSARRGSTPEMMISGSTRMVLWLSKVKLMKIRRSFQLWLSIVRQLPMIRAVEWQPSDSSSISTRLAQIPEKNEPIDETTGKPNQSTAGRRTSASSVTRPLYQASNSQLIREQASGTTANALSSNQLESLDVLVDDFPQEGLVYTRANHLLAQGQNEPMMAWLQTLQFLLSSRNGILWFLQHPNCVKKIYIQCKASDHTIVMESLNTLMIAQEADDRIRKLVQEDKGLDFLLDIITEHSKQDIRFKARQLSVSLLQNATLRDITSSYVNRLIQAASANPSMSDDLRALIVSLDLLREEESSPSNGDKSGNKIQIADEVETAISTEARVKKLFTEACHGGVMTKLEFIKFITLHQIDLSPAQRNQLVNSSIRWTDASKIIDFSKAKPREGRFVTQSTTTKTAQRMQNLDRQTMVAKKTTTSTVSLIYSCCCSTKLLQFAHPPPPPNDDITLMY